MSRARPSLIVAVARNGVIGRDGTLPWRLPDDMSYFKATTMGHHVIMGRKTWESLRRPLPGRTNVVLSRNPDYRAEGAQVVPDLEQALRLAEQVGDEEPFVIGGETVYAAALPYAERIHLTRVDAEVEGDARFPELQPEDWTQIDRQEHPADERHDHAFAICVLQRRHG